MDKKTFFYDIQGNEIASDNGIIPVTLYEGMIITIHGINKKFEVLHWNYHYGHPDENAGLRIYLQEKV